MSSVRIKSGDTERIQTPAVKDGSLSPLTGLTTVVVAVQRVSDDFWYDFNDDTFKSSGWTTRQQQMTEVSSSLAPGEYYYDFDTSAITNAAADDTYMVRIDETGASAANTPFHGEIKVDQWVKGLFDEHTSTQADIAALNDLSQADVQAAMTAQGYTTGRAPNLDNLDAAVSSRATQAQILSDATPFAGALIDVAISSRSDFDEATDPVELLDSGGSAGTSAAELVADVEAQLSGTHGAGSWEGSSASAVAAAVWSEALPGAYGAGTGGYLVGTYLDAAVSTRSTLTAVGVDAQLSSTHGAGSWATATGFATPGDLATLQAHGDVTWATATGFAVPGDAMTLTAGERSAIDSVLSAAHGAGSWATATGFATAADVAAVWDELTSAHTVPSSFGLLVQTQLDAATSSRATQADILADATPFNGAYIDVAISSRSDFDETSDPVELLDSGGSAGTSAAELVSDVESQLSSTHGAGSWEGSGGTADWTAAEREQIRFRLAIDGTQTDPTTGIGTLEDILGDTAAMQPLVDVAISTRSSHTAGDVDIQLTASHGAGSWQTATGFATPTDVTNAAASILMVGGAGPWATATGFAVAGDAMTLTVGERTTLAGVVDSTLTSSHGSGSWQTATITPAAVAAAVWAEALPGAYGVGTAGYILGTNVDQVISVLETNVLAAIAALNDLSISDVQTALTNQGYTSVRAVNLDNLDVAISSLNDLSITDVQTALTNQGYTSVRAALLDNLTNLDAAISSVIAAISALNDLSQVDVQSAMTAQGYTTVRAALIDNLDAAISGVPAAVDSVLTTAHGAGSWGASSVASEVWSYDISGNGNRMTEAGGMLNLVRKSITNRMEDFPGTPGTLILWDDNGTTPIVQWQIRDATGGGVVATVGCPAKRSAAL